MYITLTVPSTQADCFQEAYPASRFSLVHGPLPEIISLQTCGTVPRHTDSFGNVLGSSTPFIPSSGLILRESTVLSASRSVPGYTTLPGYGMVPSQLPSTPGFEPVPSCSPSMLQSSGPVPNHSLHISSVCPLPNVSAQDLPQEPMHDHATTSTACTRRRTMPCWYQEWGELLALSPPTNVQAGRFTQ